MNNIRFGQFVNLLDLLTAEVELTEPPQAKFSPEDCVFEARFYNNFAQLAEVEGGIIYDLSSGCFIPVECAEFIGSQLHVTLIGYNYECGLRQPFLYSTNRELYQKLVPVSFMLHKDA